MSPGDSSSASFFPYLTVSSSFFIFKIIIFSCHINRSLTCSAPGADDVLILLFAALLYRGIKIAKNSPDLFGSLLVVGFVAQIIIQVILNIAVVTSTVPVTGMPLPFFSYGGTAMCITMAEMGIVLNVSRQSKMLI